jgi:hypothetical protein
MELENGIMQKESILLLGIPGDTGTNIRNATLLL